MISNSELVDFLIEAILNFKRDRTTDFPKAFYWKLLGKMSESNQPVA
jgi:hypothetical protein